MAYYFGFEPSDDLKTKIATFRAAITAGDQELYKHRNDVSLQAVEELINYLLTEIVLTLPEGDMKKTMLKVVDIVQSTSTKLLNQILGKDKNADVQKTIDFFENETIKADNNGLERIGFKMTDELYTRMNTIFTNTIESGDGDGAELNKVFDDFTDAVVQHFLMNYSATLKLGMIKRKLLPIADAAIKKGVKVGNKQLFAQLKPDDKVDLCNIYGQLIFEV